MKGSIPQAKTMEPISIATKVKINAKPAEVFDYFANLKLHYYWNPSLRKLSGKETLAAGESYKAESNVLGGITIKSTNKVITLETNRKLELESKLGNIKYRQCYNLKDRGKYTIVTSNTDILIECITFGLTHGVLKQLAEHEIQTDLNYLKLAVENKLAKKVLATNT